MRGDDVDYVNDPLVLSESEALKGIPVFSTSGKRLGILDGVLVHRATGGITFLVLIRRRLFGLLRQRIVLPQVALRSSGASGGFTVDWPLRETPEIPAPAPDAPRPVVRLDPARGDDAFPG